MLFSVVFPTVPYIEAMSGTTWQQSAVKVVVAFRAVEVNGLDSIDVRGLVVSE